MFEVLNKNHDRASFDCGNAPMNAYLQTMANQHAKKGMSVTHLLADGERIKAFYTLSNMHLDNIGRELKGYPSEVPAILIGRIGIDKAYQGQGLLVQVLKNAFANAITMAKISGIAFIVIDAKTDSLVKYYQTMGFMILTGNRLVLPMSRLQG